MRYLKFATAMLIFLCVVPSYADELISIPSTLFYNKLRFGMTPDMVDKALGSKDNKLRCRELPPDDAFFRHGLDQKICAQYIYGENESNIEHTLYFTNNRLTNFFSVYKPVNKNVDYHKYFEDKVDSLRHVIKQANINCSKWGNNSRRCSFHSPIAAIDFTEGTFGTIISARLPYLLIEEYQRKVTNGPMEVSLYGLEVGKSTMDDLKNAARKNNWKVIKKEDLFSFNKTGEVTYIIKLQEPADVFVLTADYYDDTLKKFTYWFIDPYRTGGKPVKAGTNYLNLLNNKYGQPYDKPRDIFAATSWRVNIGYANEVEIRTDQSASQELTFISYTDTRLDVHRTIKDINKLIDDYMKMLHESKIEL